MHPALGALTLCTPPTLLFGTSAQAYAAQQEVLAQGIPAQPLARALEALANQSGLQLVYVSGIVRNRTARAVPAGLGVRDALARMLAGTNLTYTFLTPSTVRIVLAPVHPLDMEASRTSAEASLEEVIVTANRRGENAQHVPITIQVMTGATLSRLNVTTFEDLASYLPAITAHGSGPSQNNIYMRGLATNTGSVQSSGAIGTFPNVTVYLDEQAAQLPNRNLDVYAVDLERIEVLEGPQGTLFGAGAEAGVLRYITNKPKLDVTEIRASAGYSMTAHGAPGDSFTAVFNFPVIPARLAARAVIYNELRGGYIDNKPTTFVRASTDLSIVHYFKGQVPPNSSVIDNHAFAADNANPVTTRGLRAEALYQFNDDWNLLLARSEQSVVADGVFTEMATNTTGQPQPELQMSLFNPSRDNDHFRNTALTLNGRVGPLKLLYAGTYLTRDVEQVQDYTQYSRGPYAAYYQCTVTLPAPAAQCFSPSATWRDVETNTHQTHELRISTPEEARVRGLGGLFYEDFRINDQVDWGYLTALPLFHPIGPPTGYYTLNGSPTLPDGTLVHIYSSPNVVFVPLRPTSSNPNTRDPGVAFMDDMTRGYTQSAAYGSIDIALVPKTLVLTAGTRYSLTTTSEAGSSVGSIGCYTPYNSVVPNPCVDQVFATNIDSEHLRKRYSGFASRANLTWNIGSELMLYYTWSQGFRAGGFNRAPVAPSGTSPLHRGLFSNQGQANAHGGYVASVDFAPDTLVNNEIGWKTRWMDQRIQWNGALYQERWNDTQVMLFGLGVANSTSIINGGNYLVRGLETSATARITNALTVDIGAAWNHSELVRQAALRWRDGDLIDFSVLTDIDGKPIPDPNGQLGTPLAGAPPFQGHLRARYEFTRNGYGMFAQIAMMHQSHSSTSTFRLAHDIQGNSTAYDLPAFTTFDGAVGFTKGPWQVQCYGENLTDTHAQLFAFYAASYKAVTPNRPRTIGFRFSYSFDGVERIEPR